MRQDRSKIFQTVNAGYTLRYPLGAIMIAAASFNRDFRADASEKYPYARAR